jgi:phosphatidylserine decarboxylase
VGFVAVPGSPPLEQVYASLLASIHAVGGAPVRSVPADQSVGMVEPGEAFLDDGLDSGDESEEMEELASDTDGESATDEDEATTTDADSDAGIFDEHFKSVVRSSPAPLATAEPTPGAVEAAAAAPPAPPLALPEAQQPPRGKFRRRLTRGISSRGAAGTATPLTGDEGQPEPRKTRKRIKGPRKPRTRRSKNDEYSFRAASSDIIGIVQMEIKSASDLPRWKNSLGTGFDMDPMVVASFSEKIWRTRVQRHTLNPVFDQKLIFHVRRHEAHWTTKLAVYDWDRLSSHDHVGGAEVRVAELIEAAPKPDPATQLYPEDEDGQRPMQRFELDLTSGGAKQESVGAKHRPKLVVEAKFTPYAALRQRFWRQMLHNYDTNDSKTISSLELASMLDSLGSTLNAQTINDFWARAQKTPDVDELTFDEVSMM